MKLWASKEDFKAFALALFFLRLVSMQQQKKKHVKNTRKCPLISPN